MVEMVSFQEMKQFLYGGAFDTLPVIPCNIRQSAKITLLSILLFCQYNGRGDSPILSIQNIKRCHGISQRHLFHHDAPSLLKGVFDPVQLARRDHDVAPNKQELHRGTDVQHDLQTLQRDLLRRARLPQKARVGKGEAGSVHVERQYWDVRPLVGGGLETLEALRRQHVHDVDPRGSVAVEGDLGLAGKTERVGEQVRAAGERGEGASRRGVVVVVLVMVWSNGRSLDVTVRC